MLIENSTPPDQHGEPVGVGVPGLSNLYPMTQKVLQNWSQNNILQTGISHNFCKILCAYSIKKLIHVLLGARYVQ